MGATSYSEIRKSLQTYPKVLDSQYNKVTQNTNQNVWVDGFLKRNSVTKFNNQF